MNAVMKNLGSISCLADVEAMEKTPLLERNLPESTYQLLSKSCQKYSGKVAITYIESPDVWSKGGDTERLISYTELWQQVNKTANGLQALGLSSTDVVSVALPNVPEAHYTLWGAEAAAIVNPINYFLEADVMAEIIEAANSKVLVVHGEHPQLDTANKLQLIAEKASSLETIVVVGELPELTGIKAKVIGFDTLIEGQNAQQLSFSRTVSASDVASLFHTGGTTGIPKLARHSHLNEVYTAWVLGEVFGSMSDNCYLVGLPLFHCNAAIGSGLTVFAGGGHVLLAGINGYRSPGTLAKLYELVEHFRVTNLSGVPTVYNALMQMDHGVFDISSLQFGLCGAAPIPVEVFNAFQDKTGIRIVEGYGLTEATVCSTLSPTAGEARVGSVGIRLPYTQLQIAKLDAQGGFVSEAAVNEVGELLLQGPSVTPGYTQASKNADLWVTDAEGNVWLKTGDLGRIDAEGYVWLTGRSKELIIRGGHNIDPKIIENALVSHPAVSLAAAVGRPDAYAGEVPVAYVTLLEPVDEAVLLEYCQNTIGERAAIPKQVNILAEMPLTGVGKIFKPALSEKEVHGVVCATLTDLGDQLQSWQISVENHKTYGLYASLSNSSAAPKQIKAVKSKLAQFSFKSQIN